MKTRKLMTFSNYRTQRTMAKLTVDEISAEFTHYALMFGIVPVYYNVDTLTYSV